MIRSLSDRIIISFEPLPEDPGESFLIPKFLDGEDLNYWVIFPIGLHKTPSGESGSLSPSQKSERSLILSTSKSNFVEFKREAPRIELDLKMLCAADMLLIEEPKAVLRPPDCEKIDGRDGLSTLWLLANSGL